VITARPSTANGSRFVAAFSALALCAPIPASFSAERFVPSGTAKPQRMTVTSVTPAQGSEYPAGTMRVTFSSAVDGAEDWALFLPGDASRNTVVDLHGSSSCADQILTRKDIRECRPSKN